MTTANTQEIITPMAKAKVVIRDWITGRDIEYIDKAVYESIDVKTKGVDPEIDKIRLGDMMHDEVHREIEKFIVSVDGVADKVLDKVLNLPEDDYEFVKKAIAERRKKKAIKPIR